MNEPKNPIKVVKDNKEYIASMCYELQTPFCFRTPNFNITISGKEKPIYFKRKQIKASFNSKGITQTLHSIKYCVGKLNEDETKKECWINSKGELI